MSAIPDFKRESEGLSDPSAWEAMARRMFAEGMRYAGRVAEIKTIHHALSGWGGDQIVDDEDLNKKADAIEREGRKA